ncbi:sugar ABC transporter substrate-binding protein [Candidatus Formimonas warabiya]|uniref:Sugar ABC transporter substrate-binding protein n=1 Tax=Formimonas warabiya TaxID=1761012 RepID=A0A3G1KR73_FORW1|nr:sugar ABC transporter substrate-binding protein [Candidatus Formimonas warabiya]ATW24958.1 sugar ABC transporter substrate-binding protein [Candidatus Formimonas warabiya]
MKKFSVLLISVMMFCLIMMLTACSSQEPAANDEPAPSTDAEKKIIGMVVRDINTPYVIAMIKGAQAKCDELGYTLDVQDGRGDNLQILEHIDNFISKGVSGYIMAGAIDLKGVVPGIKKLNGAGIPVMALDSCPEGGHVDMFVNFDNINETKRAANVFIEGIKARNNGEVPEGVVIYITGALQDMITGLIDKGFQEVMAQYPQLTIAPGEGKWNNEDSYERTAELLTRYGDKVVGVYVQTPDIMGAGAVRAIETANLDPKDYGVCGIHIGPEWLEYIKEGKVLATVEFPGYDCANLAVKYIDDMNQGIPLPKIGDTITKEGAIWSPAVVEDIKTQSPNADGLYLAVQGKLIPTEVSADDERLWENMLKKW